MKYNVKYEVKDVNKVIDGGLTSINSDSEMDCASLKTTMREWFNLPSGNTTTSEVIELNGKPLNDNEKIPFYNSSLRYKLEIKSPSSIKIEERQKLVKSN